MLQKVVVVESDDEIHDRLREMLGEHSSADAIVVPSGRRAVELARRIPVDLLVVRYPLEGMSFAELVRRLRESSTASRGAQVIGLAPGRSIGGLSRHAGPRVAVLRSDGDPEELVERIVGFLRRSPRFDGSYLVKVDMDVDGRPILRLLQTKNISESGMFLRTAERLPVGVEFEFELTLEQQTPISGCAEVVRLADSDLTPALGVGARFLEFTEDGYRRLMEYLSKLQGKKVLV